MLRRSQTFLRVSPYFLFLKEQSKAGKFDGVRAPGKVAVKQYRNLSANEKAALVKRANATTFPASVAYRRMQKREMSRKNVPVAQRQSELRSKWASAKKAQQAKARPAAKPRSARRKVKKAGKKAKKSSK